MYPIKEGHPKKVTFSIREKNRLTNTVAMLILYILDDAEIIDD